MAVSVVMDTPASSAVSFFWCRLCVVLVFYREEIKNSVGTISRGLLDIGVRCEFYSFVKTQYHFFISRTGVVVV